MRFLGTGEVLELHRLVIEQSGGAAGVRDLSAIESALAQPHMTFAGGELYPTLVDKAAVLGFSQVAGHPFVDGNKRVGYAAMGWTATKHQRRPSWEDQPGLALSASSIV